MVQTFGLDKYGRTIGDVTLPDGKSLNLELVREGMCWWYRKYAPDDRELEKLGVEARSDKRGLWADPTPISPWAYRKLRRGQGLETSDLVPLDRELPSVMPRAPPAAPFIPDSSVQAVLPILGNFKSGIYHRPDCPNYSQIALKNRAPFATASEAEAGGYRQAKHRP